MNWLEEAQKLFGLFLSKYQEWWGFVFEALKSSVGEPASFLVCGIVFLVFPCIVLVQLTGEVVGVTYSVMEVFWKWTVKILILLLILLMLLWVFK